jgi:hypothetical protein
MSTIHILGIDIGKSTFYLVGYDSSSLEVCRKKLSRPKIVRTITLMHQNYILCRDQENLQRKVQFQ